MKVFGFDFFLPLKRRTDIENGGPCKRDDPCSVHPPSQSFHPANALPAFFKGEIHTIESCKQSKVTKVSTIYLAKSKFITRGTIPRHPLSTQESPTTDSGPINLNHLASFRSSQCLGVQRCNNRLAQSVSSQLKCHHLFV